MTAYCIDLGFDWGAVQSTDADGNPVHYLQWGIVNAETRALATMHDMNTGDTIEFKIYDVSQLDGGQGSPEDVAVSISNGWITSRAADVSTPGSSGISNLDELNTQGRVGQKTSRVSAFFNNETLPVWPIVSADGSDLTAEVQYPEQTGSTPASYLLTWVITATSGGTSKVFRHDPEMIVTPGN
jgi:hypothetical protein